MDYDIFEEQVSRKPDHYSWAQKFIETAHNSFWTDKEFGFSSDLQNFKVDLSNQEREIVIRSLATIGQLECQVKRYWSKLGDNLPHPSLYDLGFTLSSQEVIHGLAYERLLSVLGVEEAFEQILELDIIKGRVNYLKKHLHKFHSDNKKQFIYSLILFSLFIENIALFSQFYVISWFGRFKNTLKDTNKQVEYTSREELLHFMVGVKLIEVLRVEHPDLFDEELEKKVLYESEQAVKYECEIIDWIVDGFDHPELNSTLLKEFIKNRMNESLIQMGYKAIFEIDQEYIDKTIWFDEQVLGNNMTDFFHNRPTEYSIKNRSFSEEELF